MENYCITLDQAKRLQELGFEAPCQYWYVLYNDIDPFLTAYGSIINDGLIKYRAYHVGELGEILTEHCEGVVYVEPGNWNAFIGLDATEEDEGWPDMFPTEAQARGALLLYLLKKELL